MNLDKHDLFEIHFDESFDMNEYKCIEIDNEMLDDLQDGRYVFAVFFSFTYV